MRAVILCGGSGSRLWPESRKNTLNRIIPVDGKIFTDTVLKRFMSTIFQKIEENLIVIKSMVFN